MIRKTALLLLTALIFLTLCLLPPAFAADDASQDGCNASNGVQALAALTPSQQYAGEILAYLLKVVLGRAGDFSSRKDWRNTGLGEPLDFADIAARMTDPEKNPLDLLVLDPKILGLMRVLYHYDPELNLHKRASSILSVYPAPEFIAIRLLLLQKIHRSEKIHLGQLIRRGCLLAADHVKPTPEDLKVSGLEADEMELLRDIIRKEPHFYAYLQSPFLVKAMYEVGALQMDDFVSLKIQEANYCAYACASPNNPGQDSVVRLAILPSIMGEFDCGNDMHSENVTGFEPSALFKDVVEKLKKDIRATISACVKEKINEGKLIDVPVTETESVALSNLMVQRYITFYVQDARPLVVVPKNARQVKMEICPQADFTVILLDKNVYLAIYFDEKTDIYPAVPWLYTDLMDVKYDQYQDQLDLIGRVTLDKLVHRLGKGALTMPLRK
ncbi:MAG: hypothetical protein JRF65_06870 [Deltaproteobacteria bacterium]|nr:hypothetical protein [Deltaproteobacteria bacterium]